MSQILHDKIHTEAHDNDCLYKRFIHHTHILFVNRPGAHLEAIYIIYIYIYMSNSNNGPMFCVGIVMDLNKFNELDLI